jgi:hypothetical protein
VHRETFIAKSPSVGNEESNTALKLSQELYQSFFCFFKKKYQAICLSNKAFSNSAKTCKKVKATISFTRL